MTDERLTPQEEAERCKRLIASEEERTLYFINNTLEAFERVIADTRKHLENGNGPAFVAQTLVRNLLWTVWNTGLHDFISHAYNAGRLAERLSHLEAKSE